MSINEAPRRSALGSINTLLDSRFGLTVERTNIDHLTYVKENYAAKKTALLREHGEGQALQLPEYAKASLIIEAATIILREIAPKRSKRSKRNPQAKS